MKYEEILYKILTKILAIKDGKVAFLNSTYKLIRPDLDSGISYDKLKQIMKAAESMAQLSPDSQTKVGSCLVSEDGSTYATAYNGFIKGAPDSKLPVTRPDKYKYIVHSEINLIAVCAKEGISTKNRSVVVTLSPCINCMRAMYQAGISTVYFKDEYKDFQSQLKQIDLKINLSKVKEFTRIDLEPNK